jgi:lysozyme|tara:strand:+ start:1128 stop:1559 length:432 start_codon:yes stop_codon:yes gene_type:complete
MSEVLKKRIREHEGFIAKPYLDSLGKATIGYGHLITEEDNFEEGKEYSKDELLKLFDKDFAKAEMGADQLVGHIQELHIEAKNIVTEMVFQLGTQGVRNFKNMISALEARDYQRASAEMLDSRWNAQTPNRCQSLAKIMSTCA